MTSKFQVGDNVIIVRRSTLRSYLTNRPPDPQGVISRVFPCQIFEKIFYTYMVTIDGPRHPAQRGPFREDELVKRSI